VHRGTLVSKKKGVSVEEIGFQEIDESPDLKFVLGKGELVGENKERPKRTVSLVGSH